MSDQAKTEMSSEEDSGGSTCSPLRKWWQCSRLFKLDLGLPHLLEPRDARWLHADWLQKSLAACYMPGYVPVLLSVPHITGLLHQQSQRLTKWRVSMDVSHFSPAEISISTRDDFLEVKGGHEERPDEHGFIARCCTRKYRLPADVDASKITGTLYADGILTVEASLLDDSVPAAMIIPNKVMMDGTAKQQVEQQDEDVHQRETRSCEELDSADIQPSKGHGEEAPPEVCSDQGQYGSTTASQKHEEREGEEEEEEEGRGKPAGEAHPSVPADDNRSQQILDMSGEADHKQAVEEEEVQGIAGSVQDAEKISPPEEQVQQQEQQEEQEHQQEQKQEQQQEQQQLQQQEQQEAAYTKQQRNQ